MLTTSGNHLLTVQFLRCVAAALVVAQHAALELRARSGQGDLLSYWHEFGGVGVDIFFVISGLVMYLSTRRRPAPADAVATAGMFFRRRLIRIVPMYWFYTLSKAAIVLTIGSRAFAEGLPFLYLLGSLLFYPMVSPASGELLPLVESGWTLSFEMLFYAVLAGVIALRLPRLKTATVILGLLFIVAHAWGAGVLAQFFGRSVLFEFLLGMVVARVWMQFRQPPVWVPAVLIAVAVFALFVHRLQVDRFIALGVPSAMLVLGLAWMERFEWVRRQAGRLALLGDASYSTYLAHGFIMPAVVIVGLKWMPHAYGLICLAAVLTATAVGCLSYLLLEKPLTRRLMARFGGARTVASGENAAPV
ncbi:acyltransferase family protein [Herbaspirillum sp.]|jgi:exopolysaccharide production protein ExoZ|uniref:acyltransferase family protein n=1 Tax=Herbaspirillum TaxID=963 RepID=UPI002584405F|nr:acyltransferase [Herbaspirillum sp.]MCP3655022.1 acyltransferase [Herbaspirillum sp.]MCP3945799.1 acyltransferase [Herbaspirillum sp.]MCP4032115.1 acyltransferase [Herbaspirillum sp.]MCP4558454.1 acyltransferase [Herbaspirillum sp.]